MGGKFRESCPGIRPKSRFFPKESSQITPLPWNSGLELPVPRRIHPKSPFFPKENSQNSLDLSQVVVLLEKNSLENSEGREEAPGFRRKRDRRGERPRYSLKIHWEEIPAWEFPAPAPPSGSASDSGRTSENREFRGFFFWEFCELWVLRFLFCPESWEIPSGCGVFLADIQGKGRGIPGIDGGIPGWNVGMRIRTRRGPEFSLFALIPSLFPGNFGIFLWEFGAGSCYRLELEENREFSSRISGIEVFGVLP